LTSDWRVDDAAIANFFEQFYRYLREKRTTAEALQMAQLAMLETADTAAPYYWAAFSLIGDYQGDGEIQQITASAEGVQLSDVTASQNTTGTTAVTSSVGGLTQSNGLTNVYVVREGAEIAGVSSKQDVTTTETITDENGTAGGEGGAFEVPVGDLANGLCNNLTLPLGIVLIADLFRRNLRRKPEDDDEPM
jgi:predicted amidohydrolase